MEQWEIDFRKDLGDELKEGEYKIGEYPHVVKTDKAGAIEYFVNSKKKIKKLHAFYKQMSDNQIDKLDERFIKGLNEINNEFKQKTP
jgi:hypothetical protein